MVKVDGKCFSIESNLYWYRHKKNLTQSQLATISGLSRDAVSKLENGKFYPRLEVAYTLALVLGVNIHDLFPIIEDE